MPAPPRLLVSAGEPSGDEHGAEVVASLRSRRRDLLLEGCGGEGMASAGLTIRCPISDLGVMGFGQAIRATPRHWRLYRELVRDAHAGRFAAAILIDYPGFHLRLGSALREAGVPVVQYVAPQLWAWRPGRLPRLRAAADRVAAILPFEEQWFRQRGILAEYVGHPLFDRPCPAPEEARRLLQLPPEVPVLGIFPGSREGEIARNWPLFRDVAQRMLAEGVCGLAVVAGTAGGYYPDAGPITIHRGAATEIMAASTAALVKSGTTTLEAARSGIPAVVAYRTGRLTYEIARRLLTVSSISLVNLVTDSEAVPEFWHLPVRAAEVAEQLRPLLTPDSVERGAQLEAFARIRTLLSPRGAARRVAEIAMALAQC